MVYEYTESDGTTKVKEWWCSEDDIDDNTDVAVVDALVTAYC